MTTVIINHRLSRKSKNGIELFQMNSPRIEINPVDHILSIFYLYIIAQPYFDEL